VAFFVVLRPAALGHRGQLGQQPVLVDDGPRRHGAWLPVGQPPGQLIVRQRGKQDLPRTCRVGLQPVPDLAEDRQQVVALQPLDVHHLQAVEHGHVHHLTGFVPQRGQDGQRRLMQVDVLADVGPQLIKDQAEPVPARRAAPLEETFGRERGHQSVHGALAKAELAGQFGDAELLAGPGERTQHAGRVAHRRQLRPVRLGPGRLGAGRRHCLIPHAQP
jgi:hypothetical protein